MALWGWFAIAAGAGLLVGVESWAWMRHGTSAIALAIGGAFSASIGLLVVGGIALTIIAGVTGWDPVGVSDDSTPAAASTGRKCDANYAGACLDPDATDYDCEGGIGDGPGHTGLVQVVGTDVYDLDRDGDGTGCD
jgi:hypothetical protein